MKVGECLTNLAETDKSAADAAGDVEAFQYKIKMIKAVQFLKATGTVAEREHTAYASTEFAEAVDTLHNARADFELLKNNRKSWERGYEYWRSLNANRRQAGGNL